jgi:dTDP-4-dehydrorhamnose 3,5-epimerase
MKFFETNVRSVFEIRPEPHFDERGLFARVWCHNELGAKGLNTRVAQCSISFNPQKGTLRGMHYQVPPFSETKIVRCTQGAIYDVVIDLRPQSQTFKHWISAILTPEDRNMLYVPPGCAHGFLTLKDQSEVFYQISEFYSPESARGVRWNDPTFDIVWPERVQVISKRDATYPNYVIGADELDAAMSPE